MTLSQEEHAAMDLTVQLTNTLAQDVIGFGNTRREDITEMVYHIHAIQNMILAQSAAREYPDKYRLMGESIPEEW